MQIAQSALPVLERIRMLYESGRTAASVEEELGVAALVLAREELAEFAGEDANPTSSAQLSPFPHPGVARAPERAGSSEAMTDGADPQTTGMPQRVAVLERRLSEMQAAIENRDLMIRQILSAIVHALEVQNTERRFVENERRIADNERDRDAAHRHQQMMLSLQEILNFTRRRRWLW